MITYSAQVPAQSDEDRIVTTDHAVIVLDGATAHDPACPRAGTYVDALSAELRQRVTITSDLRSALGDAITATAERLSLAPGSSPSSTVAIVRLGATTVDLLVLGDSTVIIGMADGRQCAYTDDRLDRINLPEGEQYRARLAHGAGYDDTHRHLLGSLQSAERRRRNQPDGFWIAEADPSAAQHALIASHPRHLVSWAILATDGAFDILPTLGVGMQSIAQRDSQGLRDLLLRCQTWEAATDPDGLVIPRAKRHDDKTIAVIRP